MADESLFLGSALATDGLHSFDEAVDWLTERRRRHIGSVRRIGLGALDQWGFVGDPRRLAHRSGGFFSVEGLRTTASWGETSTWDQPILHQPEVGLLGLLTRCFGGVRHFLMQAKMEPGNVNLVQLSPTVQATRSNYMQVHRGQAPLFLEHFIGPDRGRCLVDQLQSEQGGLFLRKRNRNMVVEATAEVVVPPDFCWLTLGQIQRMCELEDCVNMDTRSVVACIPLVDRRRGWSGPDTGFGAAVLRSWAADGVHTLGEVLRWWTDLEAGHERTGVQIPIDAMRGWTIGDAEIVRDDGRGPAVIAVAVEARAREVPGWTQPMLARPGLGLHGLALRRIRGVLHALVRATFEPGSRALCELGPTVVLASEGRVSPEDAPWAALFADPPRGAVRQRTVLSDEGGRFFHQRNEAVILEVAPDAAIEAGALRRWLTLGQIHELVVHGYFNMEARSLLACLGVYERYGEDGR